MIAPLPDGPVKRVAFLGTPAFAVGVLEALVNVGLDVAVVVTREDKRRGRGSASMPSPVKEAATVLGVRVVHDVEDLLAEHHRQPIDLGIVVAFGRLIKPHVLADIPMVNLHVSLLPRWRGAAPIERSILAGDEKTGVCLMQVEEGLDTGGVIASSSIQIDSNTTADQIRHDLMEQGTALLLQAIRTGDFVATPQQGEPTYAAKIETSERHIRWSESADMVSRRVRIGGSWTTFRGRRLKIHAVEVVEDEIPAGHISVEGDRLVVGCGERSVKLLEVQPEGRGRIGAREWARGARIEASESMIDG